MNIEITYASLALLTVAMVLLRIFWLRLPPRLKLFLVRASIAMIVLHVIFEVTKWSTTSDRLNVFVNWLAIAGYELLILLFSRLSPRWLTIPSAIILLVPLFASSILMPLMPLFQSGSNRSGRIDNHLIYEARPWIKSGGNAGFDILIYDDPPFAPFLRHKVQTLPLNDQECNPNAAIAVPGPTEKTVLVRCPYWSSQTSGTFDKVVPIP